METSIKTDRQTERHTERYTDRQTDIPEAHHYQEDLYFVVVKRQP